METVSHSEVESYLTCERRHYYGYTLGVQRRAESVALTRGTLGHQCLAEYFTSLQNGVSEQEARANAMDKSQEALDPMVCAEVMECLTWFFQAEPFKGWTVIAVEQEYVVAITEELSMPFVVDLIIQDPYGEVWAIDHKFVYDFVNEREAHLLPQLIKYYIGLKMQGIRVDKVAYASLRYRHLKTPTIDSKFQLTTAHITPTRIQTTFTEQTLASLRILNTRQEDKATRSLKALRVSNKFVCGMCPFYAICVAELNDDNPQLTLDTEYQLKERREFNQEPNRMMLDESYN